MTILLDCDWPKLTGRQEPEHLLVDEGDQSEADKALEFYRRIKKPLMPWQQHSTRATLALEPDGQFTHPTVIEIATRQSGKTLSEADLRIMFGLFVRNEKIVYSAQRWKTAESIFKRINELIRSRPSLNKLVDRRTCSQGQASIELVSGASVAFITRSLDAGRGLDEVDLIIYDEAYNLTDAEIAALSPTQMASSNPQTIYLSSAVNQQIHAYGHVLARLRNRALEYIEQGKRRTGIYFAEFMAPEPPADLTEGQRRLLREDPETWRLASPSYGVIQTEVKVRKLLGELSPKNFEVEVLGWGDWPKVGDVVKPIDVGIWNNLAVSEAPQLLDRYPRAIALDRNPKTKVWAIGGAQRTKSGDIHVEIGYYQNASHTDVVEKLLDIVTEADPAMLVIDQLSAAAFLKPYLIAAGVEPVMTNTSQIGMACEGFLEDVLHAHVWHSGQQMMADAVTCAVKRDLPGGRFVWASVPGGSIEALMAATLAHWGVLEAGTPAPKHTPPPLFDETETGMFKSDDLFDSEFDAMTVGF